MSHPAPSEWVRKGDRHALLRECEHAFRDWKNAEGRCTVRIYAATEASGQLPVVIVTEAVDRTFNHQYRQQIAADWLAGAPRARTRHSAFARLMS